MNLGAVDTVLQVVQTVALGLLYLFLIGRWSGKVDARSNNPGNSILAAATPDHSETLTRLETEQERTRDRLHKLEGFKAITETRLGYIERQLEKR